uniref:(California timema) hypothetical protein n=1 Tax=Timema californicum TaxID=61474 RepID=A0A7R9JAG0_TIMCA|nr:unnamed protein product [Timema californicum]
MTEKSRMKASVHLFVVACVFLLEGTQGEDYPDPVALTNKANEENLTNILKCFYSEGECPKGTVELKVKFSCEVAGRRRCWPYKSSAFVKWFCKSPVDDLSVAPNNYQYESCPDSSTSEAQAEAPRSTRTGEQCPNAIVFDTSLINERDPCHDPVLAKKNTYFTSCGSISAVFLFGCKTFLEILTSVLYESSPLTRMSGFGVFFRSRTALPVNHCTIFPTVAVSACSNCNPTQKQWFRIVGRYLLANRPADIKKLRETFDPSEEHKEEFLKFITSDD